MANISFNGSQNFDYSNVKVRELKDDVTLEQAIEKTQGNGLDEAFVEADGKRYVIFTGDNLQIDSKAELRINDKTARVIKLNNEINSFGEGLAYVPKKGYEVAKAALQPLKAVVPNAATGLAIMTGVAAGAMARNSFTPFMGSLTGDYGDLSEKGVKIAFTAGILAAPAMGVFGHGIGKNLSSDPSASSPGKVLGAIGGTVVGGAMVGGFGTMLITNQLPKTAGVGVAIGAIAGVASITSAADLSNRSQGAKTAKAWATGVGSVAAGAAMPEIAKLVSKIHIPDLAIKGGKILGTAALVGGTMATVGLAVAGGTKSAKEDSLNEIAK